MFLKFSIYLKKLKKAIVKKVRYEAMSKKRSLFECFPWIVVLYNIVLVDWDKCLLNSLVNTYLCRYIHQYDIYSGIISSAKVQIVEMSSGSNH